MQVLEELARARKLLCPETRAPAQLRDGRLLASSGRDMGPLGGPLNFLRTEQATLAAASIPEAEIEKVRAHLALPATAEVRTEIARAIAATGDRLARPHLSAEVKMLTERFRIPAFDLGGGKATDSRLGGLLSAMGRALGTKAAAEPRLEHLSDSIGARLTAAREVFRSVRVRNAGEGQLRSTGHPMATVETSWSAADGKPAGGRISNALPVDLDPGREITLMLRLRAPDAPGRYGLQVRLAVQGHAGMPALLEHAVEVIPCDLPVFEYDYSPALLDYDTDHRIASQEVLAYMETRGAAQPATLLEIGGGVHPTGWTLAAQGHRVVSSDISHSQSILGTLYFRHNMPQLDGRLAFISCDGSELPFADGTYDGIVLFASFHHIADPRALLREMKRVIRPGGFIFIGCDNCIPDPADPTYLEEVARGINEQVWTLPEYTDFFREAGLKVSRARIDYCSLKVCVLKP